MWALEAHNIASEMLEAHPGTETRKALAHWLRKRYKDDAADWSVSWGLGLRVLRRRGGPDRPRAPPTARRSRRSDLWEFSKEMVRAYVGIPGLACNEVDPNHLNLGMRYASLSSELLYEAVGVFDVFSINAYEMEPPARSIAEITARTRRPVMIGEFHFGAPRSRPALHRRPGRGQSQRERGIAYRRYVETAAADPERGRRPLLHPQRPGGPRPLRRRELPDRLRGRLPPALPRDRRVGHPDPPGRLRSRDRRRSRRSGARPGGSESADPALPQPP